MNLKLLPQNTLRTRLVFLITIISILLSVLFYIFPFQRFATSENEVKKVYFAENITPAHLDIIGKFNELYKGEIEVVPVDIPYDRFTTNKRKELITRNLRSRSSRIDVFAVDQIWIPRFSKWAEPLNSLFDKSDLRPIIEQALKTCTYNDTLYSIPLFIDIGVLYYREDLLKSSINFELLKEKLDEGITWKELANIDVRNPKTNYKYLFHADNFEGLLCNLMEVAGGFGGNLFQNNKVNFSHPSFKLSISLLHDLIHYQKISPAIVTTFNERESFLYAIKNDILFFRGWPTAKKIIPVDKEHQCKVDNLKIAYLPRAEIGESRSTIGGWNMMISKFSSVKEEAVEFIKFVIMERSQEIIFSKRGYLPILKEMYTNQEYLNKYPDLEFYYKLISHGIHRLVHPNYTMISDIITSNVKSALNREVSINEAVKSIETEISKVTN